MAGRVRHRLYAQPDHAEFRGQYDLVALAFDGAANFEKNLDLVRQEIAKEKGCKPSQPALAWLLAQDKNIVLIPGTKRRKYLEENLAAIDVTLAAEDLRRIDEIFPTGVAAGGRYPEHIMNVVNE